MNDSSGESKNHSLEMEKIISWQFWLVRYITIFFKSQNLVFEIDFLQAVKKKRLGVLEGRTQGNGFGRQSR